MASLTEKGWESSVRVLQVASSDLTVDKLLLPLMRRLAGEGYSVAAACSDGPYARRLLAASLEIHIVPIQRRLSPHNLLRATSGMLRLLRREHFDVVHVHTPVAAAVGRVAARLAGVSAVIYTAHGFYFHDRMAHLPRGAAIRAERLLGHFTDLLFTQSAEDARSAVELGIRRPERVIHIGNGVDLARFHPGHSMDDARRAWGLSPQDRVVGFVGRMVEEKGIFDLLKAMAIVGQALPDVVLLLAGDANRAGDRDVTTSQRARDVLRAPSLPYRTVSTGFVEDVEQVMTATDVFVLPSYREGMPRSIIEAMASGKPVVATNIRGCREEVIDGQTGYLYEPGDVKALADALIRVLSAPNKGKEMGMKGRRRAEACFDERQVLDRQVMAYRELLERHSIWKGSRIGPGRQPSTLRSANKS